MWEVFTRIIFKISIQPQYNATHLSVMLYYYHVQCHTEKYERIDIPPSSHLAGWSYKTCVSQV